MTPFFPCITPTQQALGTLVVYLLNPPDSVSLQRLSIRVQAFLKNSDILLWIVVHIEHRPLCCHSTPPLLCLMSSVMGSQRFQGTECRVHEVDFASLDLHPGLISYDLCYLTFMVHSFQSSDSSLIKCGQIVSWITVVIFINMLSFRMSYNMQ